MSAANTDPVDVVAGVLNTEIVGHSGDYNGGRLTYSRSRDLAIQGLAALREAGFELVKLPEPDEETLATEFENGSKWFNGGDVVVFDDGEIHLFGAAWDTPALGEFAAGILAAVALSGEVLND